MAPFCNVNGCSIKSNHDVYFKPISGLFRILFSVSFTTLLKSVLRGSFTLNVFCIPLRYLTIVFLRKRELDGRV